MGLFDKFRQGLKKTSQLFNTDIRDLFKREGRLVDEGFLDELMEILIKMDMGFEASKQMIDEIGDRYRARVVHMDEANRITRVEGPMP